MPQEITKSMYADQMNTFFQAQLGEEQEYPLELTRLEEFNSNPALEQFSLFFHGAAQILLPQKIYTLRHPALGELEIFLVPVGTTPDRAFYQYEAVFSRFINKEA